MPAADPNQAKDSVPWINLDETDEILLCNMYAGVVKPGSSLGNSSPQLIRFLAKANRVQYKYVSGPDTHWWHTIPPKVKTATTAFLAQNQASPTAGSTDMVSLPFGTIEIKAGWRPLNPSEIQSGRFHMQKVRFYEKGADGQTIV